MYGVSGFLVLLLVGVIRCIIAVVAGTQIPFGHVGRVAWLLIVARLERGETIAIQQMGGGGGRR